MDIGVITKLLPEQDFIAPVREADLACCQVVCWDMSLCTPAQSRRTRELLDRHGIRLSSFWSGYSGHVEWNFTKGPVTLGIVPPELRARRVAELKRWADFAVDLGAPAIVTHCGFLPENMTDPEFPRVVEALQDIGGYCRDRGIGFWFETGQETPVTLLRHILATGLDNLGINLDPANLLLYGKGNPVDALDVFGPYVKSVHAKDGYCPTDPYHLGREVRLGDGLTRYPVFVPKLLGLGFTGDFIIEREISGDEQKRDILHARDLLRGWMAESGSAGR